MLRHGHERWNSTIHATRLLAQLWQDFRQLVVLQAWLGHWHEPVVLPDDEALSVGKGKGVRDFNDIGIVTLYYVASELQRTGSCSAHFISSDLVLDA